MMVFLAPDTWIRLLVWMLIGLDIYLVYGAKYSHLGNGSDNRKGTKTARWTGIGLSGLLIIAGFLHQVAEGWEADKILLTISIVFAVFHVILYAVHIAKENRPETD